jgi:hypothetical protein
MVLAKHFVIKVNIIIIENESCLLNNPFHLGAYDVDANLPYHVFKVKSIIFFKNKIILFHRHIRIVFDQKLVMKMVL